MVGDKVGLLVRQLGYLSLVNYYYLFTGLGLEFGSEIWLVKIYSQFIFEPEMF